MKKIYLLLGIIFLSLTSLHAQFNFNLAQLQNATNLQDPTTLQFGPDGKLYVGMDVGRIMVYTISKNGNNYSVTNAQTIDLVLSIQNHNDDGSNDNTFPVRQVTGLLVTGTASNPVLYVSSSDPRVGGGGTAGDLELDTNSGVISKLTWNGSSWDKVDIVRGLPRSEENHSNNGMQLDASTNTLYIAVGGLTNGGAPSNNFAYTCEYALAGAILKIDLNVINSLPVRGSGNSKYVYDLPTLDDPTRTNVSNPDYNSSLPGSQSTKDQNDPWGGNDGRNQAKLVPGGPVQIHSPGYRNAYDIVITKAPGKQGRMYTIDNGANSGWGGYPKNFNSASITNEYQASEPGSNGATPSGFPQVNNLDNMHLVSKPGMDPIYGGHPNPIRANPTGAGWYYRSGTTGTFSQTPTTDWPPVPSSMADPREAYFYMPGVDDGALTTFVASTNGITEYLSPNYFNAQMVGDILAADFNGTIWRMKMSSDGNSIVTKEAFASGFGINPLDITTQSAGEAFDGSIWVADYGAQKIFIFTPDGSSTGNCSGNNTSYSLDDDNDGYSNGDETDNGTNPCNPLNIPSDFDGDHVSDKNDNDDDADGIVDIVDAFHHDATNGLNTPTTILYPFLNGNPGTGLFGLGFTGLMINNSTDPDDFYNPDDPGVIMGGAVGLASFPADEGKASTNQQNNGFQFGYSVSAASPAFSVQSSIIGPFFGGLAQTSLNANHRQGIYIGNGDQDNFLAIALSGAPSGGTAGIRVFGESGGVTTFNTLTAVSGILSASNIYLYLDVNPSTKVVVAKYSTDVNPTIVTLGSFTVTGALATKLQGPSAIAVGLIAHSGTSTTYQSKYDFMNIVTTAPAVVNPVVDQAIALGTTSKVVTLANVFTDDNGVANLTFSVSGNTNTALVTGATINGTNLTLSFASNATGTAKIKVKATDNSGLFAEDEFNVTVSDNIAPVAKINAGGPALSQGGWSADQLFSGGDDFGTSDPITNTDNQALYQTERWGNMSYNIPVSSGSYTIKLHFAEIYFTSTGSRVFNVGVEGQQVLTNYDIVAHAGGAFKAIIETFTNISVTDGTLNIVFTGITDNAKISAIEVIPQSSVNTPPGVANAIPDQSVVKNTANLVLSIANTFTDNNGVGNLTFSVTGNTNTTLITNAAINGTNLTLTIAANQTGSSDIKVKATDAQGLFVEDQFKIDVTNAAAVATKLINAGGAAVTYSGQTWEADNSYTNGAAYSTGSAIAGTTSDALYQSERFGNFSYAIPVTNGSYIVKLHFAEIFFEGSNMRKFNVNVENGQGTLTNYDIYAKVGLLTATTEQFNITVTDGVLNISLTSVVDNAKISAIEILSNGSGGSNAAPVVANAITDKSVAINSGSLAVSFANTFSDDAGAANLTYSVSGNTNASLISGTAINGTNLTLTIAAGQSGSSNIKLKATDAQGLFVEDEFKVDVVAAGATAKLINAGGPAVTFSAQTWAADNSFTNGSTYSTTTAIANTTNDAIYQSERFGNFSYAIPITNGSYIVKLHFAEIYFNGANLRKFNVNVEGGQGALTNYDIFAKVGQFAATTEQFNVTITDGVLNLTFTSVVDQAKLSAIEVLSAGSGGNTAPVVANPIPDQAVNVSTPSLVVGMPNAFSDDGGAANITLSVSGNTNTALVTGASFNGTNLTLTFASNLAGTANIKVKATDAQGLFIEDEFKVDVTSTPVANSILINSGGPAVTFSGQTWAADKNFSGGTPYSYAIAINNTTNDAIYQTERFGNFSYAIPVTNGTYSVKLHFAETYFTSANSRKFNVNIENGKGTLTNYDIFVQAGANTAKVETFSAISVTDGTLNITFTSVTNNAKVCAIEITPNNNTRVADLDASFQASPAADQVLLTWIMPDQQTDLLTIERSKDGQEFEVFETIQSSARKAVNNGRATDIQPFTGTSYYRLKSTGRDGVTKYSVVRSVVFNRNASAFMLYPNPNNTGLVFMEIPKGSAKENLSVRILNIQGAEVYRQLKAERSGQLLLKMQLPGSINAGTYIVEVDQNGKKYHARLIIN